MHGKQQQIVAHKMKGMAYPMQLNVRNTIHNLYKLGASLEEECPPNTQTVPSTNHTAKKQSTAILNRSISIPTLPNNSSNSVLQVSITYICFSDVYHAQRFQIQI
jgi:hypothetical protein